MTGDIPNLLAHPDAFEAVTGLTPHAFQAVVDAVRPAVAAAEQARRDRPGRRRAPGAGRPNALGLEARVLAAILVGRFGGAAGPVGILLGVHWDTVRRAARALGPLLTAAARGVSDPLSTGDRRDRLLAACRALPDHGGRLRSLAFRCGLLPAVDGSVLLPDAYAAAVGRRHPSHCSIAISTVSRSLA